MMNKILLFALTIIVWGSSLGQSAGGLDLSFSTNGYTDELDFGFPTADSRFTSSAIQTDGKIVAVGNVSSPSNASLIARFNTDGTLDNTFNGTGYLLQTVGPTISQAMAVDIQNDGKIVVGGWANDGANNTFAVMRINPNGTLDNTFDVDGMLTISLLSSYNYLNALTIQNDGKIVLVGYGNGGSNQAAVVRLNTDGSLDTSFDLDGKATYTIGGIQKFTDVALQSDGKIVLAAQDYSGFQVVRINTDGSLDTSFDSDGLVNVNNSANTHLKAIFVQSDGKILAAGNYHNGSAYVGSAIRLNADGSLDTSFDIDGIVNFPITGYDGTEFHSINVMSTGEIIFSGEGYYTVGCCSSAYDPLVTRVNADGSLDLTFDTDGHAILSTVSYGNVSSTTFEYHQVSLDASENIVFTFQGYNSGSKQRGGLIRLTGVSPCILDQSINTEDFSAICSIDTTLELASSDLGVNYYLRDDSDDSVIDGPVVGTGSAITLSTGSISSTSTFNVYGDNPLPTETYASFDGTSTTYINVPYNAGFANWNSITLEAWVNPSVNNVDQMIVSRRNGIGLEWIMELTSTGVLHGQVQQTGTGYIGANSSVVIPTGTWSHVACTFDGVNILIYVNGVDVTTNVLGGPGNNNNFYTSNLIPTVVGANGSNAKRFNGSIDDLRVWANTARTASEINTDKCYVDPSSTGLYMNHIYENNAIDATANGNNGSATGNTSYSSITDYCGGSPCSIEMTDKVTITIDPIANQTVAITDTDLCPTNTGTSVTTGSSQLGVDYVLRDDSDDSVIDGPITGTGSGLTFNTGALASTTTFNVNGEVASTSGAIDFDGSAEYILTATNTGLEDIANSGMTIEFWAKPEAYGGVKSMIRKTGDYDIYFNGTVLSAEIYVDGSGSRSMISGPSTIPLGVWSHIALVWDGAIATWYINGVPTAGGVSAGGAVGGSSNLGIGGSEFYSQYFNGEMDEVRIWTETRTALDITGNMNSTLSGSETNLAGYWDLNDGTGSTTAADKSMNGNNGNLVSMEVATDWVQRSAVTCSQQMSTTVAAAITDNNPTAVCQNITVYLDGAGTASIVAADIDGGSSDDCGAVTLSASTTSFTCANVGANTVVLTATDGGSNTSTCNATVTVADTISPTAICQNITVYLDGSGNATIVPADIDGGSIDNCGTPTLSASTTSFTCSDIGANNVTLTVTDGESNTSSCVAVVTVADTVSPTAICQNITVYLDGSGNASIVAADIDGGSTDNCGTPTLSASTTSFTCADLGANNVTLTVTDGESNSSSCVALVTVADTTSPVMPTIADATDECTVTLTAPTTTDNCGGTITGTTVDATTYSGNTNTSVTWTFADGNGNSTNATQNVIINDVTVPTITAPVGISVAANAAGCEATGVVLGTGTASDNCGAPVVTNDAPASFPLGATTVTWTATDAAGLSATSTQVVTVTSDLSTAISETMVSCFGGNDGVIDLTVSGGSTPYLYDWDTDGLGDNDDIEDLSALIAGDYTGQVIDAIGCTSGGTVSITEPTAVTITSTFVDPSTCTSGDGSVDATTSGGTLPYDFAWDNSETTEDLVGLTAGAYVLTVTDGNGCEATSSATLSDPAGPSIVLDSIHDNLCNGDAAGGLFTTVTGGTGSLIFDWDNDGTGDNDDVDYISGLVSGTYNLVVVDASGCTGSISGTVADPTAITSSSIVTSVTCFGAADGTAVVTNTGGTGVLVVDFGTADPMALASGSYNYSVTDDNACVFNGSITITSPDSLELTISFNDILCNGDSTDIDVEVTGGTSVYSYDWDGDGYDDVQDSSDVVAGNFEIMVMDANGCMIDSSFVINEPTALNLSSVGIDEMIGNDGEVDLTVTGGTTPYGYDWSNSMTTEDIANLVAGTYEVIVTDANGCVDSLETTLDTQVSIIENNGIIVSLYPNPSNGLITVSLSEATEGEINVFDAIGNLVHHRVIQSQSELLNLETEERGIYFITIEGDNFHSTIRTVLH